MNKPPSIDPLADQILTHLACQPGAGEIVLGGYVALQHYAPYRQSHDIDAWWKTTAHPAAELAIRAVMHQVAATHGYQVQERRFGETISFELVHEGKRIFSFQIAVRSVTLEPAVASAWPPVLIETFHDNIASKMNALVGRGAPRDFLDIKHVVDLGLLPGAACWDLWTKKNPGQSLEQAKQNVLHHLTTLEMRRPLTIIADAAERAQAQQTREWIRRHFVGGAA